MLVFVQILSYHLPRVAAEQVKNDILSGTENIIPTIRYYSSFCNNQIELNDKMKQHLFALNKEIIRKYHSSKESRFLYKITAFFSVKNASK
jgi:hypothetical protein